MKYRITPLRFLQKNWLLVGILCCIFVAGIYPKLGSKQGPLRTEYTVKYGAVFIIFLVSGLSLKTDSIFKTFQQYKLHCFIQCFTFIFIPLFGVVLIQFLYIFGVHPWVLKGITTVASMPPPVSSAVILTRAAQGNESAAIFNSILGSFIGIIVTPILLLLQLGSTTIVPLLDTVFQLAVTVLLPLTIGQVLKKHTKLKIQTLPLNTISQCALLFVIYTTFCDTFLVPETGLSALDVLFTVFSVLLMQLSLMMISFHLANMFIKYFNPQDIIAIIFCSTHKSLTLGIPILRIMFHGYSHLSQISLPLLVYHPTQIILGGLVVPQLKDWMHSQRAKRPPV
ncbi:sodium/bile acid cotransporter 7-B-like isoform X1 [Diabrotica virgifera virgifera]|uniref:Sodium/bile acid cotransporter 7-B-like isoform X1 n=1 Tax=Diabrotica virgifera virgifera TaxID=50390 RepID=A0A6P7F686_DIAVI|nr:sodium/bile acid cotransporter 7-B-like isoform X1 [Diabrotica virgifera virgifera]